VGPFDAKKRGRLQNHESIDHLGFLGDESGGKQATTTQFGIEAQGCDGPPRCFVARKDLSIRKGGRHIVVGTLETKPPCHAEIIRPNAGKKDQAGRRGLNHKSQSDPGLRKRKAPLNWNNTFFVRGGEKNLTGVMEKERNKEKGTARVSPKTRKGDLGFITWWGRNFWRLLENIEENQTVLNCKDFPRASWKVIIK